MKRLLLFFLWLPLLWGEIIPGRYIVELDGEPVLARKGRAAARDLRQAIRAEQRRMRAELEGSESEVIDSIETVANALVVRISDAKVERLRRMRGVRRVHPVREFRLMLDHAAPLHKLPQSWALTGIDRAGAGVKIAIIDTGIDVEHPGFQDPSLAMPAGFPRAGSEADLAYTNSKVIVARSYADRFRRPDPDPSPRDQVGHGTGTAMAAAGVAHGSPLAAISGVAPRAYLGNYKVFGSPKVNETAPEDAVLKAIDDAVADGMDVINLSLGSDISFRPEDDLQVQALDRAAAAGVIVVVAAGNNGPDPNTVGSPATAASAISVGASHNDRVFAATAQVEGMQPFLAVPGSGPNSPEPISGSLGSAGQACSPLEPASLTGRIALIFRGVCTFEDKLNHAQRAGAIAALVYTDAERPDPIIMSVGSASLPASMVSYQNGATLARALESGQLLNATLRFLPSPLYSEPNRLARFSSRGPSVDLAIKPDLVAVGTSLYTAAQNLNPAGAVYDPSRYASQQGTSFSAPLVAGAAALLKSARPGLTVDQYRSLLINSAAAAWDGAAVQHAGAGVLDVSAALSATAAAFPVSLGFGSGPGTADLRRGLTISNVGTATEAYSLYLQARAGAASVVLSAGTVELAPRASANLEIRLSGTDLAPGSHEGYIVIQGLTSGIEARVPYWYGVASNLPQHVTILSAAGEPQAGALVNNAIQFRITDAAGLLAPGAAPVVTVVSGGGEVLEVELRDRISPGLYSVRVRTGPSPGPNVFRIEAGSAVREVTLLSR